MRFAVSATWIIANGTISVIEEESCRRDFFGEKSVLTANEALAGAKYTVQAMELVEMMVLHRKELTEVCTCKCTCSPG